jgi:hypothetical protein
MEISAREKHSSLLCRSRGSILPTFFDQNRAAFAKIIFDAFIINSIWQKCTQIWRYAQKV